MTSKTITVTESAYDALMSLKTSNESFSKTIIRIAKKRPLSDFFGVLSKKSGDKLARTIKEMRRKRGHSHRERIKWIVQEMNK